MAKLDGNDFGVYTVYFLCLELYCLCRVLSHRSIHEHSGSESRNGDNFYTGETMTSLLVHDRDHVVVTYYISLPMLDFYLC